jgi:hypothetical protein
MSRSGYSDDFDPEIPNTVGLYRNAVRRSIKGARGQQLLRRLRDALDAMPAKRLIDGVIKDESGDVCALGALDPNAPNDGDSEWDDYCAEKLGKHFGIATALAAEITYVNDEACWQLETPEQRWKRMRAWVDKQIVPSQAVAKDSAATDARPESER